MDSDSMRGMDLAGYPLILNWPVQWGDQDAYQHVNNTIYFRWFESAQIAYSERIGLDQLFRSQKIGPILASISCNFRLAVTYPDTVEVGARIVRIGRTSLIMNYLLLSVAHGAIAADGTSTLVIYDYNSSRPYPVPDSIRKAIEELEGKRF
jgi:acyl-CoA thioester hydrolase